MDAVEGPQRQSTSLPSIDMLDAKRADSLTTSSPFTSSIPPPYSHTPSSGPGVASSLPPGLISPPDSRRTSGDEHEQRPAPARISLPSIHETLRNETPSSYTVQPPPPPAAPSYYQPPPHPHSPPDITRKAYEREPQTHAGAPAATNGYTPRKDSPYSRHAEVIPPPPAGPYSSADRTPAPTPSSRMPSLHSLQTSSPVEPPRYSYTQQQSPHEMPPPGSSQPLAHATGYPQYHQHASSAQPTSVPPHLGFGRSTQPPPPPPYSAGYQREDGKRSSLIPGQAYGESVKRHLETFDYQASLNEVADTNAELLEFANNYRRLAHQSQRSGLVPGSTPGVSELDEMIRKAQMMQDALRRVKDVVMAQKVAATEQLAQEERYKTQNGFHPEPHAEYQDDSKAAVFTGSDPKKRRGRAAPPGRCHSCNRAETPEWRRGPDGARTLCNACGLHYAKLTRKMGGGGGNKQPIAGSNLRPKEPDSPTLN